MRALETYMVACQLRDLSHKTREIYKMWIADFFKNVEFPGHLPALQVYLSKIENPRTRHCAFRTIKTFVRWSAENGLCDDWVGKFKVKCQPAAPSPLVDTATFERIIAAIPKSKRGLRDRALYSLLYYTGCRRDGIRLARVESLILQERWLRIVTKGGKEQLLTIPPIAAQRVNIWLARRPESLWLFPSLRNPERAVDAAHVTKTLPKYAAAAGIACRVWCHGLRHAHATALVEAGVSIDVVSASLGHSSLKMTQNYARMSAARVRKAVDLVFSS